MEKEQCVTRKWLISWRGLAGSGGQPVRVGRVMLTEGDVQVQGEGCSAVRGTPLTSDRRWAFWPAGKQGQQDLGV